MKIKKIKLDRFEKQLVKDIEKDEFRELKNQKQAVTKYSNYFKHYQKKNKRISLRVAEKDLKRIQDKALKSGIPYQTLVNSLLHQYAEGDISLEI